ncbi:MAG: hypothetical protein ABIP31_00985 [Chitinophagaceae bacterium]
MAAKKQKNTDDFQSGESRSFSPEESESIDSGKPINPISNSTDRSFMPGDRSGKKNNVSGDNTGKQRGSGR